MAVEAAWPRLVRALTGLSGSRERAEDALQDAVEHALRPGVVDRIERADAWLSDRVYVELSVPMGSNTTMSIEVSSPGGLAMVNAEVDLLQAVASTLRASIR